MAYIDPLDQPLTTSTAYANNPYHSHVGPPSVWLSRLTLLAGMSAIVLGLVVAVGWHTHRPSLIRALPNTTPMSYNTALGFILCGLGLLSLVSRWRRLAQAAGSMVTVFGLLTVGEHLFANDLGIDQALMTDWVRFGGAPLGRMAPLSAVGFVCSGLVLWMLGSPAWRPQVSSAQITISSGLGILLVAIGVITLGLYGFDLMAPYGWGLLAYTMAFHTACGFVIVGSGLLAAVGTRTLRSFDLRQGLPAGVGVSVAIATVLMWQSLLVQQQRTITGATRAATTQVHNELMARLDARLQALTRMQQRWEQRPLSHEEWELDAAAYLRDFPGFQALSWTDPTMQVRWIMPRVGNEAALNLRIAGDHPRTAAFTRAREERGVVVSAPFTLAQGDQGFLMVFPLFPAGEFGGMLSAVYRTQVLFDEILAHIAPGYGIALYAGVETLYLRPPPETSSAAALSTATVIALPGVTWRVQVWPGLAELARHQSFLPHALLVLGMLLAGVVSLAMFLMQTARQRTQETVAVNHQLDILNAELEQRVQERAAALQESEARFRAVIERSWDTIALLSADGVILYVNQSMSRLLGSASATLLGQNIFTVIHPEDQAAVQQFFTQLLQDPETSRSSQYRFRHQDGTWHWAETIGTNLLADPHIRAVVTNGRDITERKQIEDALAQQLRLTQAITDNATTALFIMDQNQQCVFMNPAAEQLTGYTLAEIQGYVLHDVMHHTHPDGTHYIHADCPIDRAFPERNQMQGEEIFVHKDGHFYPVAFTASPLREGAVITGTVIEVQDISARKRAEEALAEHTRDLARAHADLRQVAYVSAHDLQEPVRQIGIYTQRIVKQYGDSADADTQDALAFIVEGTKRMQAQFTDLMHYLEIENPKHGITVTDCERILRNAVDALREPIVTNGATITHDPLPTIAVNAKQLQLVFQELLENAVKFRTDSPPRIHVWAEREGRAWRFAVRDAGLGIEPQDVGQLFGFFRKLQRRADYPGTGMGLAICKKIVERHNGRIWIDSQPGAGTTVYFTIHDKDGA